MEMTKFPSSDQSVTKYVFDFGNAIAETVVYRYPTFHERTVICCSVQSGCPVGCTFCGTGGHFIRNLDHHEITAQIMAVMEDNQIDGDAVAKFQVMFMSQGEPFLNYSSVRSAIELLNKTYPKAQLLISTIAPRKYTCFGDFVGFSRRIPQIGLQFSIHAALDDVRSEIIPYENKMRLHEIGAYGAYWHQATGRRPFFNYCVHEGNSRQADADILAYIFRPAIWECTLSVICEKDESVKASQDRQIDLIRSFMRKLTEHGMSCRMFNPAGQDDIGGGCGQLWYVQKWMREHGGRCHGQ